MTSLPPPFSSPIQRQLSVIDCMQQVSRRVPICRIGDLSKFLGLRGQCHDLFLSHVIPISTISYFMCHTLCHWSSLTLKTFFLNDCHSVGFYMTDEVCLLYFICFSKKVVWQYSDGNWMQTFKRLYEIVISVHYGQINKYNYGNCFDGK